MSMASILEFRRPELRSGSARSSADGGATADVVLFPGVRYEKWEEGSPDAGQSSRRSRKRDRLDLED
jgi:hypothetical protein